MDLLASILVIGIAAAAFAAASLGKLDRLESRFFAAGFLAHVVAGVGQVLLTLKFYGGGDMTTYYAYGQLIAELMNNDFGLYFPKVVQLLFHGDPQMPFWVFGAGTSTGSMTAVSALAAFSTGSLYASCIALGLFAFAGQVCIYFALRPAFPDYLYRRRLLIAMMLIPSVVFWSSALLKESLALGGLGFATLGLAHIVRQEESRARFAVLGFGVVTMYLVKAYILIPLALAGAVWFYRHRVRSADPVWRWLSHPAYLVAAISFAIVALLYLGTLDERFAVGRLEHETASLQRQHYNIEGGSTYVLGSSESSATAEGQVFLAPLALLSALFRPFLFEVHNIVSLISALETLIITVVFVRILYRRRWRTILQLAKRSPTLTFMIVFVIVLGTGVGLATPNLGTLSRYRIPMMPFWCATLLLLLPVPTRRAPSPQQSNRSGL